MLDLLGEYKDAKYVKKMEVICFNQNILGISTLIMKESF